MTKELFSEIYYAFQEELNTLEVIENGDWVNLYKSYQYKISIIKYNNKFYSIRENRSGLFFTDYYYDDPNIHEVTSKEVMVPTVQWVPV